MGRKIVVFIATSLDGFIATKEDSLQWLMETQGKGDNGYGKFVAEVDTVIMGRRTYEWLLREVGPEGYPYRDKDCYVLTSSFQGSDGLVTFVNEPVRKLVKRLKKQQGKYIWLVGGGKLIKDFIEAGLVDEWIVTLAPVLLGDGIPLFHKHDFQTRLKLESSSRYGQFVELHYTAYRDVS